jgi:hypothetical protein
MCIVARRLGAVNYSRPKRLTTYFRVAKTPVDKAGVFAEVGIQGWNEYNAPRRGCQGCNALPHSPHVARCTPFNARQRGQRVTTFQFGLLSRARINPSGPRMTPTDAPAQ